MHIFQIIKIRIEQDKKILLTQSRARKRIINAWKIKVKKKKGKMVKISANI